MGCNINMNYDEMKLESGKTFLVPVLSNDYSALATFLMSDLHVFPPKELTSLIDTVKNEESAEISGNVCHLQIHKDQVTITNMLSEKEDNSCTIGVNDFKEVVNQWNNKVADFYELKPAVSQSNSGEKEDTRSEGSQVNSLDDLKNTENFREGTLEHIFIGTINKAGKATGFHYEKFPGTKGKIIEGTKSQEDKHGVYTAQVTVSGIKKNGYSTFYPTKYQPQQVVDMINVAYQSKIAVPGMDGTYKGETKDGIVIEMFLGNEAAKIISAFPIFMR